MALLVMTKDLLIEAGAFETRVALLENGKVVEVHHERRSASGAVGDIYKGRVSRVVPGIQAAFVDIGLARNAFLFAGDTRRDRGPIGDEIRQGQELLVQVVKEALPGKGARISLQPSLPGRFVVLLPGATGVGVSRRIGDLEDRERLETELAKRLPEKCGAIVRTAAEGCSIEELDREMGRLEETWRQLQSDAAGKKAPAVVHRELDLASRAARDLLDKDTSRVWIDGSDTFDQVRDYLEQVEPSMVERLQPHSGDGLLFDRFGVDAALSRAMRTRVWLKSGGFIVINPTEALVAIDVNSGRHTEGVELEATARTTNLEAAEEVARQVRLRDLSGIIVVDFIDMLEAEHREELMLAFESVLERDRTRMQISQMSDFGLVAVTRKRMRGGLLQRLTEPCPCCAGEGRIKGATTVGLEMGREIARRRSDLSATDRLVVEVHPRVKEALEQSPDGLLQVLRRQVTGDLELQANLDLGLEEFAMRSAEDA